MSSADKIFERFAENECKGNSPLYYELSRQISQDPSLLNVCRHAREGQPLPNLFLAAVHFLILKDPTVPLAQYYPSVTGRQGETVPFNLFKQFVQAHEKEIVHLLQHRIVQTNVITRCNYLLPVFSDILSASEVPVTIIDIGASAGLNLNFDRYEYYYDNEKVYGDSAVKLHCQVIGTNLPPIKQFQRSITKIGIDQHPVDLTDTDELTWLQALVWPDQVERFVMLKEALNELDHSVITLIAGSTIADFKTLIDGTDNSQTLVLYATHVLYQFPPGLLDAFYKMLDETGRRRDFYFLSAESMDAVQLRHGVTNTAVVLTTYKSGRKEEILVAETNGHGNWLKWSYDC